MICILLILEVIAQKRTILKNIEISSLCKDLFFLKKIFCPFYSTMSDLCRPKILFLLLNK